MDLSYESLRANTEVDIRVYGSAADLPLRDRSVDAIVSLYAIHHFGGQTRRENESRVARGFAEFGRVLKPGGSLFIFELSPWWPIWQAQCAGWNLVRKSCRAWISSSGASARCVNVAAAHLGRAATLRRVRFHAPALTPIPPVFACPP